jgi:hypothetical protein
MATVQQEKAEQRQALIQIGQDLTHMCRYYSRLHEAASTVYYELEQGEVERRAQQAFTKLQHREAAKVAKDIMRRLKIWNDKLK